jgi:site-specific recombinase XerD
MAAPRQYTPTTALVGVTEFLRGTQRQVQLGSLSRATFDNYARDLHEFVSLVGPMRNLDDLEGENIDEILVTYASAPDARFREPGEKTRGVGATRRFRASLSRFFTHATEAGWVRINPMSRSVVRPRSRDTRASSRTALSAPAASALLEVPTQRDTVRSDMVLGLRDEFILRVLTETGARVGELVRADRSDISEESDGIWLQLLGKGSKVRRVPLSSATWELYQRYEEHERPAPRARSADTRNQDAELTDATRALLLTWRGRRMRARDIQNLLARSSARMPARHARAVTPHGLRHTAATLLLEAGVGVHVVKELLGHASIATTSIYLDSEAAALRGAIEAHPVTGPSAHN